MERNYVIVTVCVNTAHTQRGRAACCGCKSRYGGGNWSLALSPRRVGVRAGILFSNQEFVSVDDVSAGGL